MGTTTTYKGKETPRRRIMMSSYKPAYFATKALADGTFTFSIGSKVPTSKLSYISYSLDNGQTWIKTDNVDATAVVITTPTVLAGDTVLWKGEGTALSHSFGNGEYTRFSGTADHEVSGNITSLLYGDMFQTKQFDTLTVDCTFWGLFQSDSKLISAGGLVLPSKRITAGRSYQQMFYLCSNLITPPKILLETFTGSYVMASMFNACSNLVSAPDFVINNATRQCCQNMFYGCAKITKGPDLLALSLANTCYGGMFNGCSALTYIKMMATDISASSALSNWVNGVNSVGTFVKNANAQWTLAPGASGIPTNFTVITA